MRKIILPLLVSALCVPWGAFAKTVALSSPDGKLTLKVSDDEKPSYQLSFNNQAVIEPSALGISFKNSHAFDHSFKINTINKTSRNDTWQQPWGERAQVTDHHNELLVTFNSDRSTANQYKVRFRLFNDGLGFRYEVTKQPGLTANVEITSEDTQFNIAKTDGATAWWIPARGWNRYEYVYNTTGFDKLDRVHTPFTFKNGDGVHVAIHEAALVNYASMTLNQARQGKLEAYLTPWSDGIKVKTAANFHTPWRTIQVSKDAVGLLNSDLILNLNEPNKLGDVSWVEPGKYVGIWWGMHINENTWGSGEKHGATTSETMRYIDFAAKYGFSGVLVEGWNIGWDGSWFHNGDVFSFTNSYDDFDLAKVTKYGLTKGVRLVGHHETSGSVTNYRKQMADAYDLYEQHGVRQIKTGYVADGGDIKRIDDNGITRFEWHDGQFMVNEYLHSIKEAAKRKISINTHEPVKATGLRRTYPNWIAREGARGQEFNAWGTPPNPPEHTAILPYTRLLGGPIDFTPGIFDMGFNGLGDKTNRPQTTLAKQLALYVVLYSPIQMAADLPRNYEANLPAFQFIRDVPVDWHDSIALAGEIGDYVVFARKDKHSQDWFLGALTDENARTVDIDLSFLAKDKAGEDQGGKSKKYLAQIYRDGDKAEWKHNPYDLAIEEKIVTANDKLTLTMATSGGVAIRFKAQ